MRIYTHELILLGDISLPIPYSLLSTTQTCTIPHIVHSFISLVHKQITALVFITYLALLPRRRPRTHTTPTFIFFQPCQYNLLICSYTLHSHYLLVPLYYHLPVLDRSYPFSKIAYPCSHSRKLFFLPSVLNFALY